MEQALQFLGVSFRVAQREGIDDSTDQDVPTTARKPIGCGGGRPPA